MGTQRISLINKQYLPEIEVTRKKKKLYPITRNEKRWWQKSKTSSRHFIHWRRSFHEDAYESARGESDVQSKERWPTAKKNPARARHLLKTLMDRVTRESSSNWNFSHSMSTDCGENCNIQSSRTLLLWYFISNWNKNR